VFEPFNQLVFEPMTMKRSTPRAILGCLLVVLVCICQLLSHVHAVDVDALLQSMTLNEKVGQMTQIDIAVFYDSKTQEIDYTKLKQWIDTYQIGSVLNSIYSGGKINGKVGWTASDWRVFINKMQTFASETRLKIPILYGNMNLGYSR
jgi:hypothetical protein